MMIELSQLVEYGAIAPALLAAITAAAGLAKSELVDRPAADRQRKLRATEIALSPFTKLQPQTQVKEADPFGSAIGFGATGMSLGQQIEGAELAKQSAAEQQKLLGSIVTSQNKLRDAQANALQNPTGGSRSSFSSVTPGVDADELAMRSLERELLGGGF